VPDEIWDAFRQAESHGKYGNAHIFRTFRYRRCTEPNQPYNPQSVAEARKARAVTLGPGANKSIQRTPCTAPLIFDIRQKKVDKCTLYRTLPLHHDIDHRNSSPIKALQAHRRGERVSPPYSDNWKKRERGAYLRGGLESHFRDSTPKLHSRNGRFDQSRNEGEDRRMQ